MVLARAGRGLARAAGTRPSPRHSWSCCLARGKPDTSVSCGLPPAVADHVVVMRLAAGVAQERRYPAIRRDRSCRNWSGLFCTRS